MRNVLIYTTSGASGTVVESMATTWEELQVELSKAQISYSGMKAVVGETRVTLESPKAVLEQGDFTLFLMPKKTKSGGEYDETPYKECRSTIKDVIDSADDKEKAKKFFSDGDRNYTQTTTNYMRKRLNAWFKKTKKKVSKKVAEVVESVKEEAVKAEVVEEEINQNAIIVDSGLNALKAALSLLNDSKEQGLFSDFTEIELDEVNAGIESISVATTEVEAREAVAAKLAEEERIREEKKANLAKEAKDISREFSDVRNL